MSFLRDLRVAAHSLRHTPGVAIAVILTLSLGIGANAAIFTLVNAILLHNLPVVDPKTLVRIGDKDDCCVNGGWRDGRSRRHRAASRPRDRSPAP